MVFHTDLHRFVATLKEQLGPQLRIVPLLYEGVPELRDILNLFEISLDIAQETLTTRELRARFQSLVEKVFAVLAETRLFALFLDDLHEADESYVSSLCQLQESLKYSRSFDLVNTLASSRNRIVRLLTLSNLSILNPRSLYLSLCERTSRGYSFAYSRDSCSHGAREIVARVRSMFFGRFKATWIHLDPLAYSSVASLVARTLHQSKDNVAPLARLIHSISAGNAFSIRNLLATLQRQRLVGFQLISLVVWAKIEDR